MKKYSWMQISIGVLIVLLFLLVILQNINTKKMSNVQTDLVDIVYSINSRQDKLNLRLDKVEENISKLQKRIDEVEKASLDEDLALITDMQSILESYQRLLDMFDDWTNYIIEVDDRLNRLKDLWDKLNFGKFTATAYSPFDNVSGIENDGNPNYTATGTYPDWGTFAVDPDIIPYGSKMIVIGEDFVEHGVALDTGGTMRKHNYWIDLYRDTYKQTLQFGKQDVVVIWKEEEENEHPN